MARGRRPDRSDPVAPRVRDARRRRTLRGMSHLPVRWTPAARRRALAWLVGWATYGVAVAGLRIALSQAALPSAWRVISLMTLAVVCGWAALTPAFAWLERHLRRARIGPGRTLLV